MVVVVNDWKIFCWTVFDEMSDQLALIWVIVIILLRLG